MKQLAVLTLLLAFLIAQSAQAQVAPGTQWTNGRGSVLTIKSVDPSGMFEGEYVNNAAGFGCQGTPYPATGWINNDSIGWLVNWKNASADCRSITSWSGVLLSPTLIESMWSLGYTSTNHGPRVMVGSDFFQKK
jgi:hypothetical protein